MFYLGLCVLGLFVLAGRERCTTNSRLWDEFKQNHSKVYESKEVEAMRRAIFERNLQTVNKFNEQAEEAKFFRLGINHLSDLSEEEIKVRNGFRPRRNQLGEAMRPTNTRMANRFLRSILARQIEVPDELDWRKVPNRVSRVKDQGLCGSCWAFASTGALEGQEAVRNVTGDHKEQLVELSEQNLVDCVGLGDGCSGGMMTDAYSQIKKEGGIDSEEDYPYEAVDGKCRYKMNKAIMTDKGFAVLPEGDEETLKEVVAKFGPVAIAIDASVPSFQFYHGGIYVSEQCNNDVDNLDHGVLVVGYGTDPKKGDYWIVKNSWSDKWGEGGYIRMARNKKNQCGIATLPVIPTF